MNRVGPSQKPMLSRTVRKQPQDLGAQRGLLFYPRSRQHPHFANETAEAQRGLVTCPRPHSRGLSRDLVGRREVEQNLIMRTPPRPHADVVACDLDDARSIAGV